MAFRGRGGIPGGRRTTSGSSGSNRIRNYRQGSFFLSHRHPRPIYVTYNYNAVLIMEVVMLVVALFLYFYNYESVYIKDPIERVKTSFLDIQFGGTIFYIVLLMIVNSLKDMPEKALKCFIGLLALVIIFCSAIGIAKFNMDTKYTEEKFTEMYSEYYFKDKIETSVLGLPLNGSGKQVANLDVFKRECENLYKSFTLKVMVGFVVQFVLLLLNLYLIVSVAKSKEKYDKAQKENDVLFDEEQNVKV